MDTEIERKFKELFKAMKDEILKEIDEKYMRKHILSPPSAPIASVRRLLLDNINENSE